MQRDDALPLAPMPVAYRPWLDSLIEREVLRLRARYELSLDELRGLYISDAQVDALLRERAESHENRGDREDRGDSSDERNGGGHRDDGDGDGDRVKALTNRARALAPELARAGAPAALKHRLALHECELALLLLALAPDIDSRYEALYAYLNNDVTRRHLSADLAQRLLQSSGGSAFEPADPDNHGGLDVRAMLSPHTPLVASGALELLDDVEAHGRWRQDLRASVLLLQFCLGLPLCDPRWGSAVSWSPGNPARQSGRPVEPLTLISGFEPDERRARTQQWAAECGLVLLHARASLLAADTQDALVRSLLLAARLACAALVIDDDKPDVLDAARLRLLAYAGAPLVLLSAPASKLAALLGDWPHRRITVSTPDAAERARAWRYALHEQQLMLDEDALASLARRHVLSPTRIRATVAAAGWTRFDADDSAPLMRALDEEAAARANEGLGRLASRMQRDHGWDQLVLPDNTARQLREIADAIRVRELVYSEWGMQKRTGRSAGLMMLFCGSSGTGKTMAASVVSNAAGLPLYRIELASVVSKYIGETEQNLDRIFRAAEHASAVLLFDEADALLGRRAEVKDAQDRYANLEVAYLLQKMEDHDGVVILASNLPKNLDSAFARRMHYTVEFSRPGAALRERLWRGMLPLPLPREADIDFRFLGERFDMTGGEIQAATLDAAFLAAAEGHALAMRHLMHSISRRQAQQGNATSMARCGEHALGRSPRQVR